MAFSRLLEDLSIIAKLDDEPNDVGGLTADELKAKYDQGPLTIQTYINTILLPKLESIIDGASAAESLGSATITGVSGHTIHAQLSDLKNQIVAMVAGAIPADSLTDALLSSATGAVKSRVAALQTFPTATGTGTAISVTCPYAALTDGIQTTFVSSANNGGAATTLDLGGMGAKPVYKPGGTTAPTIAAGKAYTVWYSASGDCFFVKAGAEGTATAGHVLAGQTFSNDNDVGVMGTLALRPGDNTALTSTVAGTTLKLRAPAGYYDGVDDTVQIADSDFVSGNIRASVNIFGVSGNSNVVDTSPGTAAANDMLSGKIAFVDGVQVTGSIPSKGAATITPGTSDQTIAAGQYLSGAQTVASLGGTATAAQVLSGVPFSSNSAGRAATGTIPSKGAATITPGPTNQTIAAGQYLSGTQTISGDADLVPSNIKSGVNIFGVDGTVIPAGLGTVETVNTVASKTFSGGTSAGVLKAFPATTTMIYFAKFDGDFSARTGLGVQLTGGDAMNGKDLKIWLRGSTSGEVNFVYVRDSTFAGDACTVFSAMKKANGMWVLSYWNPQKPEMVYVSSEVAIVGTPSIEYSLDTPTSGNTAYAFLSGTLFYDS